MIPPLARLPVMLGAVAALVCGLDGGLARLGWPLPRPDLAMVHGPLMICAFFGTVIGVERAVALARPWAFAAPALTALGGLLLIAGRADSGALALAAGASVFALAALVVTIRQRALFTAVMALGAVSWAAGSAAWAAGAMVPEVVPLWAAFLVLTIAGERIELSRFLPPWRGRAVAVLVPLALLSGGAVLAALGREPAWTLIGSGLLLLTAWTVRSDIARRTIRQSGLTRYVAVAILSGYAWLAAAGMLALRLTPGETGLGFDAALHCLFVGFVFAMVFGHAPVILPAVLKVRVPFHPAFYAPLALLQLALAARVLGDLAEWPDVRAWGGMVDALTIVGFMVLMAAAAIRARRAA